MQADTSACRATASICLAASRTISSSTEPLASLGSASSWTTLSMGVPSRPARQRRHMIRLAMGYRSSSGRCAPSRHPAEDHPQVLIIAPIPTPIGCTAQMMKHIRLYAAEAEGDEWAQALVLCAGSDQLPAQGFGMAK